MATCYDVTGGDGAVRPPVEAGTHRNDSGDSLNVVGIHVLQGVEDVNSGRNLGEHC